MLTIREIMLIFLIGVASIISYNVSKVIYKCDEVERKTLIFERNICIEQQLINTEIKEIRDEEIPDINDSVGKHNIVL